MYKILFEKHARKQFFKLSRDVQKRLTRAIDSKLAVDPRAHLIPLCGDRAGLFKFRDRLYVVVVKMKHRQAVYRR